MLLVMFGAGLVYSGFAVLPAGLIGNFNTTVAFSHHLILGALMIAHTFAFYAAQPDWLAVNNGLLRLTPFQALVYSHWTPWALYLISYLMLIFRLFNLRRQP